MSNALIESQAAKISELQDKLLHSDRKEITACYRTMDKQAARIAELADEVDIAEGIAKTAMDKVAELEKENQS